MKKILVVLLFLILTCFLIIYLFIPATPEFSSKVLMGSNASLVTRLLTNKSDWAKWFPGDSSNGEPIANTVRGLNFRGYHYNVESALMNYAQIAISGEHIRAQSLLTVLEINKDSVLLEWKGEILKGINPVKRVKYFFVAKQLQDDLTEILFRLKTFLANNENAYGINVIQTRVVDTLLMSTKFVTDNYPTTAEIYSVINKLKTYVSEEGAQETNPPMLNVAQEGSNFRTMVALPISNLIPGTNDFVIKRMVPGKILVAEVQGGSHTTSQALNQLNLYLSDNELSSPAIPFESLITDRSKEPDTTKWKTKVYFPIY